MAYDTTLQHYIDAVKGDLSLESNENNLEWSDPYVISKVNEARQTFWNQAQYKAKPGMVPANLTANSDEVTIPDGVDDIRKVRLNDGLGTAQILTKISMDTYLNLSASGSVGRAYCYVPMGKKIRIFPKPGSNVTNGIEFWGNVSLVQLDEGDDVDTSIESRWKNLIVRLAVALCWAKAEQHSNANANFAIYEKQFANASFDIKSGSVDPEINSEAEYIDETDERHFGTLS